MDLEKYVHQYVRKSARIFAGIGVGYLLAAQAHADEFRCPAGASDSGYQPGNIIRWCEVSKDGRQLYHGPVWRWHRNGAVAAKENYVFGDMEGEVPSWYENGNRSSLGSFKAGHKIGDWKYWDRQGRLTTAVTYAQAGNAIIDYYPGGAKKAAGQFGFNSGEKTGLWIYWDEGGREKARCDFGGGVFKVLPGPCKFIAEELEPVGFSRPVATGSVDSAGKALVRVADQRYELTIPAGWKADAAAGLREGLPLALNRAGDSWRGKGPNLYLRVLFKEGATFEQTVKKESEYFRDSVTSYEEEKLAAKKMDMNAILRAVRYRPVIPTDSPFSVASDNVVHETLCYLDASQEVVLVAVLTSSTAEGLKKESAAFEDFARSARKAPVEKQPAAPKK